MAGFAVKVVPAEVADRFEEVVPVLMAAPAAEADRFLAGDLDVAEGQTFGRLRNLQTNRHPSPSGMDHRRRLM